MRKRNRKRDDQAEVNMTPMLDIVFILLIFFIKFIKNIGYPQTINCNKILCYLFRILT